MYFARVLSILLAFCPSAFAQQNADAIYHARAIHTLEPGLDGADSLAVAGDRILAIGRAADLEKLATAQTRRIRVDGVMLPGLIDAHGHVAGLGSYGLGLLDLSSAKSFDDVIAAVREKAKTARKGEWILGGRWDHESWPDRKLPTHERLSEAAPENPVWLRRVDGHAGLANALAMRIAGITKSTEAPPGGEIIRDASGEPTGVFVDNAMNAIAVRAGAASKSTEDLILKAQEMCLAAGLTGVHDAGVSPAEVEVYQRLEREGRLKLRVYGMLASAYAKDWFAKNPRIIGPRFTLRATKAYADGAMGSRGAWLLAPYADRPSDADGKPYTGLAVSTPESIREIARDAVARGYQVCTHAIGDRANREVLDAYAAAIRDAAPGGAAEKPDHRFRIEHAQLLAPTDIARFAPLGVIASMQPTHCTSDMRWVDARVGPERSRGAYAWNSLLKSGAMLAFGSDFPVESHNPMLGLYAGVTRQTVDGQPAGGWHADERLSREQTLRAHTLGAAYAAFEENDKGTLKPGKLADFVIVDRDFFACPERDIASMKVLMTVIGGEVVYEAGK
ncbi:MAG: amidohydrolase [Phycisphaerales bacterium]|nr:amidohydrolase [Phycisphaerales bacterium]